MKFNRKVILCALLVLIVLCSVNACSAEDTFNETLAVTGASDVSLDGENSIDMEDIKQIDADSKLASDEADGEIGIDAEDNVISAAGDVIYVSTTGSDANDGKSQSTAVATLKHAVEIADGKIIMLSGQYTVTNFLNITKDLEIVGHGDVTIRSNVNEVIEYQEWDDWYEEWETKTKTVYSLFENNANLNLTNIKFTLVPASLNTFLIENNANLMINTAEFTNIKSTGYQGIIRNNVNAKLTVDGTKFNKASGKYGSIYNNGVLLVNNSEFTNNDQSSETGSGAQAIYSYYNTTVINSVFTNNKGRMGGAIQFAYSYTIKEAPMMEVINCTFKSNVASSSDGGAIKVNAAPITVKVKNSTFNSNSASRGGALYALGDVDIESCVFTGNGGVPSLVYAYGGTTNIHDSVISQSGTLFTKYSADATITANDNWWGTNDQPTGFGSAVVDTWVKMDASYAPAYSQAGDEVTVTATFDNDNLPDGVIKVTFTSTSGNLNSVATVNDAQASVTYTLDANDEELTATSSNAVVVMPIEEPVAGAIYVSTEGNDANDGMSQQNAVATIAHAIEIATAGKIIILEGNYAISETLKVLSDLDITGEGTVTIDGNSLGILENSANLNLTNLIFTNAKLSTGSVLKDNGNTTINNCTFFSCVTTGTSSAGPINNMKGTMTINDSKFYNNKGARGVIASQSGTNLIINNSEFYDNDCTSFTNAYGIIYLNSAAAVIENTEFRNNRAKNGAGIYASRATSVTSGSVEINNVTFINNTAFKGQGGGVFASGTAVVNINDSKFIENKAVAVEVSGSEVGGWGSALYTSSANTKITVTQSVFIDNTANNTNYNDAGIYIGSGKLDISDSIILAKEGDTHYAVTSDGATITAEDNWWGSNDAANTNANVNKIVKLNATYTPENALPGDEITIVATFDNDNLPSDVLNVTFTSTSGNLNEVVPVKDSQASVTYTIDATDSAITVSSSDAEVFLPFDVDAGKIFVLPGASDSNPGTRDAPVGTIAHAIEIAARGQIVLLEGTHKTGDLGTISGDLNITGEGNVIIDADNNNRILYVGEEGNVVIKNVVMVKGYSALESGALLGNSHKLTLINCTLANSSAADNHGGAIYNVGELTIINSTIDNNVAREGGAIFTHMALDITPSITIINSTISNNYASGNDNFGGGAIFAQQIGEFIMENTSFINNRVGTTASGGAIFVSHSASNIKITGSEFIANHANGQDMTGGGAIYRVGSSNYEREGTLTITDTLFENNTCDANGGAIYVRATTLTVSNSVLINNKDANGLAVYGYAISGSGPTLNPVVTLNDNWWGSNDSPKNLVGSNTNYKPTLNRWAILTAVNDSEIVAGNTVKLTVSINNYTTGSVNGTLTKPITVPRGVTIKTTTEEIEGTLVDGEFTYDYTVPENINYIAATVDNETQILFVVASPVTVEAEDIVAKKYDKVNVVVNVTSFSEVNSGNVELYVGDDLIATIPVSEGKAIGDVVISKDIGVYDLTVKFSDDSGLFIPNETAVTLNVTGVCELWNSTFFNFFDENGELRKEINDDKLVFHGDFSDLGVDVITIPKGIIISGDNAKVYDMAFALLNDGIQFTNMTVIANMTAFGENSGALILVNGRSVELNRVTVNYTTPRNVDAFAILAKYSSEFVLIDSTIIFDSNNDNGAIVNQHALQIRDSDDYVVSENVINATLPARDVAYTYYYSERTGIDQDLVLAIGIQNGENGLLTENEINVVTKLAIGDFPTIDTIMVDGVTNLEISNNNITHLDSVNAGNASYSNAIDLYNFDGITVKDNNVLINSTAGIEAKGTAYPVQATGPYSGLLVDNNNLTSVSHGPALGVYSQNFEGATDITVTNNYINVTGLATPNEYALVSGMELQDTVARVYNNTIYTASVGEYADENALYGISYAQITYTDHTYDIRDNTVYTDGKYAVYLCDAQDSTVTYNELYAHELLGDAAVNVSGTNNVVINNTPSTAKETPILTVTPSATSYKYGADAVLTISLTDEDGNPIEGFVNVNVDGTDYVVAMTGSTEELSISGLETGNYTVNATFAGDDIYEAVSNCDAVIVINKSMAVTANVTVEDIVYGNPAVLKITDLCDVDGKKLSAFGGYQVVGPVNPYGSFSVSKGKGTAQIKGLPAGDYQIYVVFGNNPGGSYEFENYIVNFTVFKATADLNVEVAGNNTGVSVEKSITTYVDVFNATGKVQYFEGETQIGDDKNVNETLDISDLSAGTHTITVKYVNDNNYDAEDKVVEVTVLDKEGIEISASAEDVKVDQNATVEVTLSQSDAAGNVSVTVDGVDYTAEVEGGSATVVLPLLPAGEYTFDVAYSGDDKYESNTTSVSFAVEKYAVDFTKAKGHPGRVDKNATVDVILSQSDATGTVSMIIDGVEYSAELVDGSAVIYAPLLPAGTYNADVVYSGDDKYENNTTPITFNVNKYYPTMKATAESVRVDENATVNVALPSDATGTVTITVDGEECTADVVDGTASVVLPVISEAGSYEFDVVYSGDDKYRPYTTNVTFNVIKNNVDMKATARTVRVGEDVTVNVVLSSDATGSVSIVYDDVVYGAAVEDGAAAIVIPDLPIGQYALTVEYSGDDVYKAKNTTVTFNVNKQNSALKATARTVKVGDNVTVNVALSSDATGTVLINVDGTDYTAAVVDGAAVIVIPDLAYGQYALEVQYSGDDKYKARNTTVTFNVNKQTTTMKATARTVKVGENVTVNVKLASDVTGEVIITVNGVDYTATVEDGVASIVLPDLPAGQYSLDVKYGGDDKYKNQSTTVTFNVNKHNVRMRVTASYNYAGDFAIISSTLSDDATGTVSVDVNGNEFATDIVEGSALIAISSLPAGDYTLDVKYSGDDKYKDYTVTKTLEVNK